MLENKIDEKSKENKIQVKIAKKKNILKEKNKAQQTMPKSSIQTVWYASILF
jgi:hypothetical protein